MPKVPTLSDVVNISTSAPSINANNKRIEQAFQNTLSRDGSGPNQMEADLDLNSHDLLNVGDINISGVFSLGGVVVGVNDNTLAKQWANAPEDVEVDPLNYPGQYSAYHWAQKAEVGTFLYTSVEQATSAIKPDNLLKVSAVIDGELVEWVKESGGPCLGGGWAPAKIWTPKHFSSFQEFISASGSTEDVSVGTSPNSFSAAVTGFKSNQRVTGSGINRTLLTRNYNAGTFLNVNGVDGVTLEGLSIDMGTGTGGGHGIRNVGNFGVVRDLKVSGYFQPNGGMGGTGVLGNEGAVGLRFSDLHLSGAPLSSGALETFGWIFPTVTRGFAHHIYSENALGNVTAFAHELKNEASWNNLHALTAYYSLYGLGYGQQTVGISGARYNVVNGLLTEATDRGYQISEGNRNLLVGMIHDPTDGPGVLSPYAVGYYGGAERNVTIGAMSLGGSATKGVSISSSPANYTSIAMMGNASSQITEIVGSASTRNVTEVLHPGGTNTIRDRISDTSGAPVSGTGANVTYCHATGERIGTLSGVFLDVLGNSNPTWNASHKFRYEDTNNVIKALGTNGSTGNLVGITHAVPGTAERGSIWHQLGNSPSGDFWAVRGWGKGTTFAFMENSFQPATSQSNSLDLGASNARWRRAYVTTMDYGNGVIDTAGTGTPEGNVSASRGSTYRRRDGGAGTSFYVKESGTGNTGWVAK